eukprot:1136823-Pelagomonas_calceolata.AAC.3
MVGFPSDMCMGVAGMHNVSAGLVTLLDSSCRFVGWSSSDMCGVVAGMHNVSAGSSCDVCGVVKLWLGPVRAATGSFLNL